MCTDFTFDEIDYIITDKKPPEKFVKRIEQSKCKLIYPEIV
jgi:DeoR/GlpR family transcriptional regulator of sugar metabolism